MLNATKIDSVNILVMVPVQCIIRTCLEVDCIRIRQINIRYQQLSMFMANQDKENYEAKDRGATQSD